MKKKLDFDPSTGEVLEPSQKLNVKIVNKIRRTDGSLRIQEFYDNCPTMTEQHVGHVTDINYLVAKFKPDELAAYIAARNQHRLEINNHDFSKEPDLQGAKNVHYQLKKSYEELPDDVRMHFPNHVSFLKFINNPANAEKMLKLGLMTKKQIQANTINDDSNNDKNKTPDTTKTNEAVKS